MKYDVDYFIKKFKAIPATKWCVGDFVNKGKHCALGHCGVRGFTSHTEESNKLLRLFQHIGATPMQVNDNADKRFKEPSPKSRILSALKLIKETL